MPKEKNPETIKKLVKQLVQAVRTDRRSFETTFVKAPMFYDAYDIDRKHGLTLETIEKNVPRVSYRFVKDDLAVAMPVETIHPSKPNEETTFCLRLPLSCKDLESEYPSDLSQLILCRQLCTYLVQFEFRFSDPDAQLLMSMDTEMRQRVNLLTALFFQPVWLWKEAKNSESPIRKTMAQNYLNLFSVAKEHIVYFTNLGLEDVRNSFELKEEDIWD